MNEDTNLNNMLNDDTVVEETDITVQTVETPEVEVAEDAPVEANEAYEAVVETPEVEVAEDAPMAGEVDEAEWVTLFAFLSANASVITNADMCDITGFQRIPNDKYVMFCTRAEENAELILFERPNTLWMPSGITPTSITVHSSGLVIKSVDSRFYVGKNNIVQVSLTGDEVSSINTISRAKNIDSVKVVVTDAVRTTAEIETIKLHVKRISPRLYNQIKDLTTHDEIKIAIYEFMVKITDLNHLIKLERELLFSLGL